MPPSTTTLEATPRILKEAKRQAIMLSNRIKTYYQHDRVKNWEQLEATLKIPIPPLFKSQPFTYANVCAGAGSFCNYWETSYEQRLTASLNTTIAPSLQKVKVAHDVSTFGSFTLYPEQEGTFRSIFKGFFSTDKHTQYEHAVLQDGYPGLGKTIIAAAVIAQAIKDGVFAAPQYQFVLQWVIIFTPKTLIEHWNRTLTQFGLGEYLKSGKIVIFSESLFMAEHSSTYVEYKSDPYTGEESLEWSPTLVPILVVLDESHHYNNPKSYRTKCLLALYERSKRVRWLHLSATPGEKINDMFLFTVSCRKNLLGTFVDTNTFKYFSQLITPRPDKPNREAMKRYRKVMVGSGNIISAPYVKPAHKAVNVLELVDFSSPRHKEIYDTAINRYLEACRKGGKNTAWGKFRRNVELAIFRKTVEPLRADHLAARAADNFHNNRFATAIGTEFKETITDVAFQLVDKYNIGRDNISIIWGGKKEYKKAELIPPQEMKMIMSDNRMLMAKLNDRKFRARLALTIRFEQDQHEHFETLEEQDARHEKLRYLRLLGGQSLIKRQEEIDNFQNNTTRICLFTAATGGVGLSLDKNNPSQLVREGLFSMGLSGKVFRQLLGRLVRRNSIADAIQRICAMRNTVEHWFVAPLMDKKLKCIAELVSSDLDLDIEELMATEAPSKDYAARDLAEAIAAAEEDNTLVNELAPTEDDEDTENEEALIKVTDNE